MKISAHILPRRVILALILAIGWGLRYWGLAWGPDPAAATHPEEWTWQIIDALSFGSPTYPGIWTQAFYSLAALVRGAISTAAGWLGVWLGEVRTSTELILPAKLAGRVTVAFLGGLQVWMAYMVARRYFDSVATGLLAAAALAVSPVLVAQSHYLALDVPLGLAVMGCLWAAWWVAGAPGAASLAVAGLALGLTITTKASGVLVAPVVAGAYVLAHRRGLPERWQWAAAWPLAFAGGLLGGLLLGYPGFLVRLPEVGDVISASFGPAAAPVGDWWTHLSERGRQVFSQLRRSVGLEFLALWLAAAGVVVWRRQWQRLLLLIFPPLYLAASLGLLKGSVEGQQAVWLPVAIMAASWPLVLAARRLPGDWWPVAGVTALGVLLCAAPLWRSLEVGYLFWQQDTFSAARFWLGANLPPGAEVLAAGQTPPGLFPGQRRLGQAGSPQEWPQPGAFLLVSSLGPEGDPCQWSGGEGAGQPESTRGWQLVQALDLRASLGGAPAAAPCFPRWVSPRVEVYAAAPTRPVGQPLAIWRPGVGSGRGYALIHGDQPHYSRAENNLWLKGPGLAQRVLRLTRPLDGLGLDLHNAGQDLALVEVRQGLLPGRLVTIYPGQELHLPLKARNWPPMVQGFYPVRVVARRGAEVLAHLEWDPLLRGRRALEDGAFALAADQLQRAARLYPGSFESQAMLAGALARLGRHEEAGAALAALSGPDQEPARTYQALAAGPSPGGEAGWAEEFSRFTGYHYPLLRQATSLTYAVGGPACQSEGEEVPIAGAGFHGGLLRQPGKAGGSLRLWLEEPFPSGRFAVELGLAAKGAAPAGDLARVEVWGQDQQGSRRLAARAVRAGDLAGVGRLRLPIALEGAATRLELRLHYLSPADLRLTDLTVGADLPAHLRQVLRWYHDAWGRVSLAAGRYNAAVASFEALLALDPGFSAAYLPLAQALISAGRLEAAHRQVQKAEELFAGQPAQLVRARDLYALLQRPADQARVEQRLADLRPSLKREARFSNGLALLGYDLGAAEVRAGAGLDLGYYWRVWSQPPLNYYVFVHLKGQDDILTFDHLLDHGRRDMTGLRPGETVREDYRITIPATARPGRYRLLVGMWDPRFTGQRVPVAEGEGAGSDEVLLTTLEIR